MALTTLALVQDELKGSAANATDDAIKNLNRYIATVTTRIQSFGWRFEPFYRTKKITATRMNVNSYYGILSMHDYAVEIDAVNNDGTALSIGSDVFLYPSDNEYPISQLRLSNSCSGCLSWFPRNCSGCPAFDTIQVTGWWAVHQNPDGLTGGWLWSNDSNVAALNVGQSTITVTDADGDDSLDRTPRFSAGNLLRIDDEMILVLAVDTTTNVLTVRRGVNGSTAASHLINTLIYCWEAEETIVSMATRQVAAMYARRGAFMTVTTDPGGVSVQYPPDLIAEIKNILQAYNFLGS